MSLQIKQYAFDEIIMLLRQEEHDWPDRIIDAHIHCLVNPSRILHVQLPPGYTMASTGSAVGNSRRASSPYLFHDRGPAPRYTESLDAAMMLIPETVDTPTGRWDWQLEQTNGGLTISARVGPQEEPSFADTPAVALCLAAMRARRDAR